MPDSIAPMLATASSKLPSELDDYAFEYKWDGVRAIAFWDGRSLRLQSRNRLDITRRYPELHSLGRAIGARRKFILDGEICALDDLKRPSFALLQERMHVSDPRAIARLVREIPAYYFIFDLLYLDGRSTMDLPFTERRRLLEALTIVGPRWKTSPSHVGQGKEMLDITREHGLEGIVAKKLDSVYEPGRRSRDWLKIKIVQSQEFVIGGWIPESGDADRARVGSLQVGYFGDSRARLLYHAGGVGSGFSEKTHARLMEALRPLRRETSPFLERVAKRGMVYVEPTLIAEVEFRRWPEGGQIQHAVFKGLREDKDASEVVKEMRSCVK